MAAIGAGIAVGGQVAELVDAPRKYGSIGAGTWYERGDAAWQSWWSNSHDLGPVHFNAPAQDLQLAIAVASLLAPIPEAAVLTKGAAFEASAVTTRGLSDAIVATSDAEPLVINALKPSDPLNRMVNTLLDPQPGVTYVIGHGNGSSMSSGTAWDVANVMESSGYSGGPVCFASCFSGTPGRMAGGDIFAARLQSALDSMFDNVSVWAPDGQLFGGGTMRDAIATLNVQWHDFSLYSAANYGDSALLGTSAGLGLTTAMDGGNSYSTPSDMLFGSSFGMTLDFNPSGDSGGGDDSGGD